MKVLLPVFDFLKINLIPFNPWPGAPFECSDWDRIEKFVEVTAENPAKQFDMYPKKGTIAPGSDADIIVVDPNGTTLISADTQKQNMDYTLFEGFKIRCSIDQVFSRGDLISVKGDYVGASGRGEFIKR